METLKHRFVDAMPEVMEVGILYISMRRRTALHLCICGCGNEVATPFSPTDWQLSFDGESVSLSPSIGNWEFACRSHYWITDNKVELAGDWSEWQVRKGREKDKERKRNYYAPPAEPPPAKEKVVLPAIKPKSTMKRLASFFKSLFN